MTSTTKDNGRLCNQIIRNIAVSIIAQKHNLLVNYCNNTSFIELGIFLFIGTKTFENTILLTDTNYFNILNSNDLKYNLNPNENYFQTKEITNLIYEYLNSEPIKNNIINNNKYKERYNNNNDLFVHIRLGDMAHNNPGLYYYINTINRINYSHLYISTDSLDHPLIFNLKQSFPKLIIINSNEINTIQFASTCKNIILSHGSFSAVIGYLSFFSQIYYPEYESGKIWYGDMFSINNWNKCSIK